MSKQKSRARLDFETEILNIARSHGALEGGGGTNELGFWFVSWRGAERFKNLLWETRPHLAFHNMGNGQGVRVVIPDELL